MDTALRNRIIGAIVLVALAVIFLPMLVKGPASDSGVADVSTDVPNAPDGQFETRELPLVTPGQPGANGATGMPAQAGQPKPATETLAPADAPPAPAATNAQGLPLVTAGGDYAVSFGAYASTADADIVIDRLRQSGLDAFRQDATIGGKPAWRVRVGPYANQSQAEIARIAALKVRSDVKAEVISLDATTDVPAAAAAAPAAAAPNPDAAQLATQAPPAAAPPKPEAPKPAPTPAAPKPAAEPAKPPVAAVPKPAATGVGFALQVGAFGKETDANALRDKLRGNGFSSFVEPVSTDSGRLFRVRVGPVSTRAEADQLKAQVAARNGLTGIVRPHP
ncbi:Cell division protein DedD (protein involved in septation) [Pseudoxanthomonas sp. GM95]|uniref:SPOR domain-containing protein n=1 Tax=Pseudoxanthomonas sp. GM95 TaxID=1881043 RepID=UPI0008D4A1AF|nr:SPOR domain-containing protein [Pseudoxanthomonas sp. GM95]SEK64864.1 Cell division protein DedD (protein involved in septation) [Pseudoxanthomonas sp. GM95]